MLGIAYDSVGRYRDAINIREKLLKIYPPENRYELILKIADDYIALGEQRKSIEMLYKMKQAVPKKEQYKINLRIARGYLREGNIDSARLVLWEYRDVPEVAYELGLIYEDHYHNLDSARIFFNTGLRSSDKSIKLTSQMRRNRLDKLFRYRRILQDTSFLVKDTLDTMGDTLGVDSTLVDKLKERAKTEFLLAELFLTEFNEPDSALAHYEHVYHNEYAEELRPKTIYCIAWIYENLKNNKEKAREWYKALLTVEDSIYVKAAKKKLDELK